jgi:hypothetical protein
MAQYEKNGLTALADLASDIMGVRQFNRSEDYQNRMLDLYDRQVANDEYKVYADYLNRQNNKPTANYTYPSLLQQAAYATVGRTPQEAIFSSIPRSALSGQKLDPRSIEIKGFQDGKDGFVSRGSNLGQFYEEIQPSNLFGIGSNEYSTKMITDKGDTVYQTPRGLFPKDVIRKKGGPASKEYIKAKQRHDRLLKNATPSNNIGMDQLLRMFGF